MHERVMRENYAKAYKLVVILAVVLAVVSAVAIPLSLSRQIRDAAKFGFNVFHNYTMTRMEDQYPMKEFLDAVHSVNGYAMIHLQHLRIAASDYKPVMERVVKYMNHPATYWWYLFDEPGIFGVDVEQLTFFNDMIRKLDPYHNVVSSSWYQGKFQDSVDVDIPQWYHGHAAGMAKTSSEYRRNAAGMPRNSGTTCSISRS